MLQDTGKSDRVHARHAVLKPVRPRCLNAARSADAGRRAASLVIDVVAKSFRVAPGALRSKRRGAADVALARQIAMYLLHCCCELSLTEAGTIFQRDRTTVAHGCKRVEDLREDALFDWRIDRIEGSIRAFHRAILLREIA